MLNLYELLCRTGAIERQQPRPRPVTLKPWALFARVIRNRRINAMTRRIK